MKSDTLGSYWLPSIWLFIFDFGTTAQVWTMCQIHVKCWEMLSGIRQSLQGLIPWNTVTQAVCGGSHTNQWGSLTGKGSMELSLHRKLCEEMDIEQKTWLLTLKTNDSTNCLQKSEKWAVVACRDWEGGWCVWRTHCSMLSVVFCLGQNQDMSSSPLFP